MRLKPIEKPVGLMMRVAFWMTRRQFGKVMTPMKVLYPRVPEMMKLGYEIVKLETKGVRLDPELRYLIGTFVSQINGCGFCADIGRAMATREQLGTEKFDALADYRTIPLFSDRERAALAFVEEATRSQACIRRHLRGVPQALQRAGHRRNHVAERGPQLLQPYQRAAGN